MLVAQAQAQLFTAIWPEGKKPNSNGKKITDSLYNERIWRVATPGFYSFLVPRAENTGTSVLICPGGGYERVSHIYNGFNLAKWFNSLGINAFVLLYRLPHQQDLQNKQLAPLQDAQRALHVIRQHASEWNLQQDKIGIMGISAGGHVATMAATNAIDVATIKGALDSLSFRPDFMVLLSPVITMGPDAHPGSRKNFLGADSTKAMVDKYSNELQVTKYTPPTFIVHAMNDKTVSVKNSMLFGQALISKDINCSLHIFPQGGHGIRMDENPGSTDLWLNLLEAWLKEMNFLKPIPFK